MDEDSGPISPWAEAVLIVDFDESHGQVPYHRCGYSVLMYSDLFTTNLYVVYR
jgi:hypothetical protein